MGSAVRQRLQTAQGFGAILVEAAEFLGLDDHHPSLLTR
jgi:hypothetical protein